MASGAKGRGKRVLVLGLGSFGTALAQRLASNGCQVTGVDSCEQRVDAIKEILHEAIVADVTDRAALSELNLRDKQAVFVSLGERMEMSTLTALHLIELGATQIYAKAITPEHGRILKKLGVERVIFPEMEIAIQTADQVTWPNVLDFHHIDPEISVAEMAVPESLVGKTLLEAEIPRRFQLYVVGIKSALDAHWQLIPNANTRMNEEQILLLLGRKNALATFRDVH